MINIKNKRIVLIFFGVVLLLFLLLVSYKAVLTFTNLTPAQEEVFNFLEGKQELPKDFTNLERSHLEDVKQVMKYTNYAFYALFILATVIITYYRKDKNYLFQLFNHGGKTTVAAIVLFGLLSLLFFEAVFTVFHTIFFSQGNWQFPADSLLIQTFPLEFFVTITRNIFLVTLFFGILFILLEYSYKHVLRYRN